MAQVQETVFGSGELPVVNTVAILCAAKSSVYKQIEGCDVYDQVRDARTFPGGIPVVAHPPCRHWSAFCRHQAKGDRESEKALGVWCVNKVKECGGVLEQPAHSKLWEKCGLPEPGKNGSIFSSNVASEQYSIEIPQYWFWDTREKNTWLYICRVKWQCLPEIPFRLKPEGGDRRIWQLMFSKNARERTPIAFAQWLVECARRSDLRFDKSPVLV